MLMPSWPEVPLWGARKKTELSKIRQILAELGNPHLYLPPTIHIAGTNGKGSSLAMLRSIYEEAGCIVSTYSSPHIIEFNERIYLAGRNISDNHINELILEVKEVCDKFEHKPGFFEGTTIMAMLAFARAPADILIIETGLGGRLDTTNVIENPLLTLITPISYDHSEYLGDSLTKIAREKAGIMKKTAPCVISKQTIEVADLLHEHAANLEIPSLSYEYDFGIEQIDDQGNFIFSSPGAKLNLPAPNLLGYHQYINAAAVICCALTINNMASANDHEKLLVSTQNISDGLLNTKWPGRIEKIDTQSSEFMLPENITLYIDGAHNPAGAESLGKWMQEIEGEWVIILGMTKGRDIDQFLEAFANGIVDIRIIQQAYAVNVTSEPSSYESQALAQIANASEYSNITFKASYSLEEALSNVASRYKNKEINVMIMGSLFLISDLKSICVPD